MYLSMWGYADMAVFASRQIVLPPITVTITGTGNSRLCYATINGVNQYQAGTHEVNTGDTITFGVFGGIKASGTITIDGTQVLEVRDNSTKTYDWTVPSGISTVEIAMTYNSKNMQGIITVTTA